MVNRWHSLIERRQLLVRRNFWGGGRVQHLFICNLLQDCPALTTQSASDTALPADPTPGISVLTHLHPLPEVRQKWSLRCAAVRALGVKGRSERFPGIPASQPPCKNNGLVRTTRGVVSASSGTLQFGGFLFWLSMKTGFFL